ncbi:AAA family ATPase [Methylomonas sp. 2BW1-5-20]|uniref:AAA family ATPase n=1 Tax=Methylomonas sp. 2BW1-5-20 TaxID=3376686 RepID=UPI00404CD52D
MIRISSFSIEALHGLYSYRDCSLSNLSSDLIILYGDNGCGKTTILYLLFHLLSSQTNKGHLNSIAKVQFKHVRVFLSDGSVVSAERHDNSNSLPILFKIQRANSKGVEYSFIPETLRNQSLLDIVEREMQGKASAKATKSVKEKLYQKNLLNSLQYSLFNVDDDAHKKYLNALQDLQITCYFMAADRRMACDSIEDTKAPSYQQANENSGTDLITRIRTQYIKEALNSAAKYINRQIIGASNTGSKSTNDIYADLIYRISTEKFFDDNSTSNVDDLVTSLTELSAQNRKYSDLGLAPELDFININKAIKESSTGNGVILNKILSPYIDSLTARLKALQPVGMVIENFLNTLNSLFKHKTISFSPSNGFMIYGTNGGEPLGPEKLSSGEQQLLLLFCYLLVAKDKQSIFIIDEPEISLNIKWQRELINAMREIISDSSLQIIIATHSIELLSQHDDMVIALDPEIYRTDGHKYGITKKNDQ